MLCVQGLSKSYTLGERRLDVLQDVTFHLRRGESCTVVGPSGSGKSTLLGLCAGLDRPSKGSIYLGGHALAELDEDGLALLRNKLVGFVFQTFHLITTLTAQENVMVPLEIRGARRIAARARALLDRVGLGDRADHYPAQLSGGEQQRVALARAFINEPGILFADEPTGNLDGETSAMVEDLLFSLKDNAGTTLLLVTHDPEIARRTDRRILLRDGSMVDETELTRRGPNTVPQGVVMPDPGV